MSRSLTHEEFYELVEQVKIHRDGIGKKTLWKDAIAFTNEHLRLAGKAFTCNKHSLQCACKVVGVEFAGRKPASKCKRCDCEELTASLEILARAVARLYERFGEPMPAGLSRVVALARREQEMSEKEPLYAGQ